MVYHRYNNEIEIILTQFVAAFDDAKIRRVRKETNEEEIVIPRWVVAPKSRVFYDIVNKAGNITLPVCVVDVNSITLRKESLENKQLKQSLIFGKKAFQQKQPVPVNVTVTVTFFSKYMTDMWQMISNFATFTNPYIFISWSPDVDTNFTQEFRTKVTWDGSVNLDTPKGLSEETKWLLQGTASFTLETWLLNGEYDMSNIITKVNNKLVATSTPIMTVVDDGEDIDYISKEGWPVVTNVIIPDDNRYIRKSEILTDTLLAESRRLVIEGMSFFKQECTGILFVPEERDDELYSNYTYTTIDTIRHGKVSGYALINGEYSVGENHIKVNFNGLPDDTKFDIIVYNTAGYVSLREQYNTLFVK